MGNGPDRSSSLRGLADRKVKDLRSQGVKLTEVSTDWIIAHPETTKTKRAAIKILTTKAKK